MGSVQPMIRLVLPARSENVSVVRHALAGLAVTDPGLASVVVSRVLSAIGSRADLSIDRLSDAILLGDAISSSPESFVNGRVQIALEDSSRAIVARIGPLKEGAAESLL